MYNKNFENIEDIIGAFPNEQVCIYHLEKIRWNDHVISPFDKTSKVYKCQKNKYKCKNTGKYFNVRTNTLFDGTKIPLQKWFIAIWLSTNNNIKPNELANHLSVTRKTASLMLKRIEFCYQNI